MRILVTANITPFLTGGADAHTGGLIDALQAAGHTVEILRLPFKFSPIADIERLMSFCDGYDLSAPNGQSVDRVISLQFPGYGMHHPRHVVWLMHQHRAVYELYDPAQATAEETRLREAILAFDNRALRHVSRRFANSRRVAQRLAESNGLTATPLYHPSPEADTLFCEDAWDYVFYPSRLESLKRQALLIEAARLWKSPVKALIGGEGGQWARYQRLIERYDLGAKVRLLGRFSTAEKRVLYAHALGVVFVPWDEDLGYVTLEAMYAGKPVLTCTDSGGPLEFVVPGATGEIVPPDPQALAATVDGWWANRRRAREMGAAGRAQIQSLALSWTQVAQALCQ